MISTIHRLEDFSLCAWVSIVRVIQFSVGGPAKFGRAGRPPSHDNCSTNFLIVPNKYLFLHSTASMHMLERYVCAFRYTNTRLYTNIAIALWIKFATDIAKTL